MKQKAKDTKTAKLGRINIDYQVLHDAFFVYQSKPRMSKVGDLYYEGKEYEVAVGRKPGKLSEELKSALGVTDNGPPPWLINMQRYGPPPSYPHLRVRVSRRRFRRTRIRLPPGGWETTRGRARRSDLRRRLRKRQDKGESVDAVRRRGG